MKEKVQFHVHLFKNNIRFYCTWLIFKDVFSGARARLSQLPLGQRKSFWRPRVACRSHVVQAWHKITSAVCFKLTLASDKVAFFIQCEHYHDQLDTIGFLLTMRNTVGCPFPHRHWPMGKGRQTHLETIFSESLHLELQVWMTQSV
jgi:hypothetical protein